MKCEIKKLSRIYAGSASTIKAVLAVEPTPNTPKSSSFVAKAPQPIQEPLRSLRHAGSVLLGLM